MEVVATRDFVQIGSLLKFPIQFFRTPPCICKFSTGICFLSTTPALVLIYPISDALRMSEVLLSGSRSARHSRVPGAASAFSPVAAEPQFWQFVWSKPGTRLSSGVRPKGSAASPAFLRAAVLMGGINNLGPDRRGYKRLQMRFFIKSLPCGCC